MKKRDNKTTVLQENVAEHVLQQQVTNPKKNINFKKAIIESGGSPTTARVPKIITDSKGYLAYMEKHDITPNRIAGLISESLNELAPGENLGMIKLAAQILGMLENNVNVNVTQSEQAIQAIQSIIDGETVEQDKTD